MDSRPAVQSNRRLAIALVIQAALAAADIAIPGSSLTITGSVLLVPLVLAVIGQEREVAITGGVAIAVAVESGRRFDEDDLAFVEDLALRAATAVQNSRLYAAQERVAHTLQASLLPERLPELAGWEAEGRASRSPRGRRAEPGAGPALDDRAMLALRFVGVAGASRNSGGAAFTARR